MEVFRTGEFARRNGVSVQLLKYYDQHGILHPAWRDETGRHYMDYQCIAFVEHHYLSRTGLSLQEIARLRNEGSLADWHTHLSNAHSKIEKEIAERQILLQYVDEMRDCLEQIQQKKGWRIEPWEGGWFLPKDLVTEYLWKKDGNQALQIWQRVSLSSPPPKCPWGMLLPKSFPQKFPGAEPVKGGLCFVYVHSLRQFDESEFARTNDLAMYFSEPLQLIADNDLKPRGDLYQRRLCVTHEGPEAQMHVLTRIPLEQEPPCHPV